MLNLDIFLSQKKRHNVGEVSSADLKIGVISQEFKIRGPVAPRDGD